MNKRDNTDHKIVKTAITSDADQALEAMLRKINTGNQMGRVGKRDLASWIVKNFSGKVDKHVGEIQLKFSNDLTVLRNALKELKDAERRGVSKEEINSMADKKIVELRAYAHNKSRCQ